MQVGSLGAVAQDTENSKRPAQTRQTTHIDKSIEILF